MPCEEGFESTKARAVKELQKNYLKEDVRQDALGKIMNLERQKDPAAFFVAVIYSGMPHQSCFSVELWRDDIIDLDLVAAAAGCHGLPPL